MKNITSVLVRIILTFIIGVGALNLGLVSADNSFESNDVLSIADYGYAVNEEYWLNPFIATALLEITTDLDADGTESLTTTGWRNGVPTTVDELTKEKLSDFQGSLTLSSTENMTDAKGVEYLINVYGLYFNYLDLTEMPDFGNNTYPNFYNLQFNYCPNLSDISGLANANFPKLTNVGLRGLALYDISPISHVSTNTYVNYMFGEQNSSVTVDYMENEDGTISFLSPLRFLGGTFWSRYAYADSTVYSNLSTFDLSMYSYSGLMTGSADLIGETFTLNINKPSGIGLGKSNSGSTALTGTVTVTIGEKVEDVREIGDLYIEGELVDPGLVEKLLNVVSTSTSSITANWQNGLPETIEDLTAEKLGDIYGYFYAYSAGIKSFHGMQYMNNVTHLQFHDNEATTLPSFTGQTFPNLYRIYLQDNNLEDLSGLSGGNFSRLTYLDVQRNNFNSLTFLSGMNLTLPGFSNFNIGEQHSYEDIEYINNGDGTISFLSPITYADGAKVLSASTSVYSNLTAYGASMDLSTGMITMPIEYAGDELVLNILSTQNLGNGINTNDAISTSTSSSKTSIAFSGTVTIFLSGEASSGGGTGGGTGGGSVDREFFTITKIDPENGDFNVSATQAELGSVILVKDIICDEGYEVDKIIVDGQYLTLKDDMAYFIMPSYDISVSVIFIEKSAQLYTVYCNEFDGISVTALPNQQVEGESVVLQYSGTPAVGKTLSGYLLNYNGTITILDLAGELTLFTMPDSDVIVIPYFSESNSSYAVRVSDTDTLGSYTFFSGTTGKTGDTLYFMLTSNDVEKPVTRVQAIHSSGKVEYLTGNSNVYSVTFDNSDIILMVTYGQDDVQDENIEYGVYLSSTDLIGNVSFVNDKSTGYTGDSVSFMLDIGDASTTIKSISAIYSSGVTEVLSAVDGVYSVTFDNSDIVLVVTYGQEDNSSDEDKEYEVFLSSTDTVGQLNFVDNVSTGYSSDTVSFVVEVADSSTTVKTVSAIHANGVTQLLNAVDGLYTVTFDRGNITILASYQDNKFNISVGTSSQMGGTANGYIELITEQVSLYDNYLFKIHPDKGYDVEQVIENYIEPTSYNISMISDTSSISSADDTIYTGQLLKPYDLVLNATFRLVEYKATASSTTDGTISLNRTTGLNYGDSVVITVTPDQDFELESLWYEFMDGTQVEIEGISFAMPAEDVVVHATFKSLAYHVNILSSMIGGTVEASSNTATEGTEVTLTATPNSGYSLESYTVVEVLNNTTVPMTGVNTFNMPNCDVLINATFVTTGYDITIKAETEGGVPYLGKYSASKGEFITIYPNALEGYAVDYIEIVNNYGAEVMDTATIFIMNDSDTEVFVFYKKIAYDISYVIKDEIGGFVQGDFIGYSNDVISLTMKPDTGYICDTVVVEGKTSQTVYPMVNDTVFTMPTEDVFVYVTFVLDTYNVHISSSVKNALVTATPSIDVTYNEQVSVDVNVGEGYSLKSLYYVETDVISVMKEITQNQFAMPAGDVIVYAITEQQTYNATVLLDQNGYGLVGIEDYGMTANLSAGTGVVLEVITAFEKEGTLVGATIKELDSGKSYDVSTYFTMPASDILITPIFKGLEYTITVEQDIVGGLISTSVYTAMYGDEFSYTTKADAGYKIVGVQMFQTGTGPNYDYEPVGTYFTMPNYDVTISALFEVVEYGITVRKSNDSIDGNSVTTNPLNAANYGELVEVVLPSESVGVLKSIKLYEEVNGVEKFLTELYSPYTFTMPASNVIVEYEYVADGYKVEIASTSNGTVSTSPAGVANEDDVVYITTSPNIGYSVSEVIVESNGTTLTVTPSQFEDNRYSFTMPANDVRVIVTFKSDEYDIKVVESAGGEVLVYNKNDLTTPITKASEGTPLEIRWITYSGYHLSSMSVTPENIQTMSVMSSTIVSSYTMTNSNLIITPSWTFKDTYVTIDNTPGGSITVGSAYNQPGSEVSLQITADTGYEYVDGSITISNVEDFTYDEINQRITFTMPYATVFVTGTFEQCIYNITVLEDDYGIVSVDNTEKTYKERVSVSAEVVSSGYVVESLFYKYNGDSYLITGSSFLMPATDVEVYATYVVSNYNIIKASADNGTFTITDLDGTEITTASYGQDILIKPLANSGYTVDRVMYAASTVSGLQVLSPVDGVYTMPVIYGNMVVSVTFKVTEKASVQFSEEQDFSNGTASLSSYNVSVGDSITVYASPSTGYYVSEMYGYVGDDRFEIIDNVFTMLEGDVYITVIFDKVVYEVLYDEDEILIADNNYFYGDEVTFTIAAKEGYTISSVFVISSNRYLDYTLSNGVYTFTMPAGNATIHVDYIAAYVNGSVVIQGNGIAILNSNTELVGSEMLLRAIPMGGYYLSSISVYVDEVKLDYEFDLTEFDHTFIVPDSDYIVYVEFVQTLFDITVDSQVVGGKVTFNDGLSSLKSAFGDAVTVTIEPDEGYLFDYYTINKDADFEYEGSFTGTPDVTKFTHRVTGDASVYAHFTALTSYKITVPTTVSYGLINIEMDEAIVDSPVIISVEPEMGYQIDTAAYIEIDTNLRTDLEFDAENIAVISMPESDIEFDVTFALISEEYNDLSQEDPESNVQGDANTDVAQTESNGDISDEVIDLDSLTDEEVESDSLEDTEGKDETIVPSVNTGVLTGDHTAIFGLVIAFVFAIVAFIVTSKKK